MSNVTAKIVTPSCRTLAPADPGAAALCREMTAVLHLPIETLSTLRRIDYRASGALPIVEQPRERLAPEGIAQAFLEYTLAHPVSDRAHRLYARRFGTTIPWAVDRRHRPLVLRAIRRAQLAVRRADAQAPGAASDAAVRAQALLDAIRAPRRDGGLGLHYENHDERDVDVNAALDRGFVGCDEFRMLYCTLAPHLGLSAHPIELPGRTAAGDERPHSAVMVLDARGARRIFVDLQDERVCERPPAATYRVLRAADLVAIHLFNRSFTRTDDAWEMTQAPDAPLLRGLPIAPDNALLLLGLGVYHYGRDENDRAQGFFRKVLALQPGQPTARRYLCIMDPDDTACAAPTP
jgi:hypothetical protein